jgi:hypothetical protein
MNEKIRIQGVLKPLRLAMPDTCHFGRKSVLMQTEMTDYVNHKLFKINSLFVLMVCGGAR